MTFQTHHTTRRTFALDEGVAILSRTPATLDAMLRGLPEGWLDAHEGGESWSPLDVVGHLVTGERTNWMTRIRTLLEYGESRAFEPFDRFAMFTQLSGKTIAQLLDEFASSRQESLRQLASLNLTPADFDRRGRHPDLGVVTLRQLLATWVTHDLDHIVQISRVLAGQYTDEVGPWRVYLRVVRDPLA